MCFGFLVDADLTIPLMRIIFFKKFLLDDRKNYECYICFKNCRLKKIYINGCMNQVLPINVICHRENIFLGRKRKFVQSAKEITEKSPQIFFTRSFNIREKYNFM